MDGSSRGCGIFGSYLSCNSFNSSFVGFSRVISSPVSSATKMKMYFPVLLFFSVVTCAFCNRNADVVQSPAVPSQLSIFCSMIITFPRCLKGMQIFKEISNKGLIAPSLANKDRLPRQVKIVHQRVRLDMPEALDDPPPMIRLPPRVSFSFRVFFRPPFPELLFCFRAFPLVVLVTRVESLDRFIVAIEQAPDLVAAFRHAMYKSIIGFSHVSSRAVASRAMIVKMVRSLKRYHPLITRERS